MQVLLEKPPTEQYLSVNFSIAYRLIDEDLRPREFAIIPNSLDQQQP